MNSFGMEDWVSVYMAMAWHGMTWTHLDKTIRQRSCQRYAMQRVFQTPKMYARIFNCHLQNTTRYVPCSPSLSFPLGSSLRFFSEHLIKCLLLNGWFFCLKMILWREDFFLSLLQSNERWRQPHQQRWTDDEERKKNQRTSEQQIITHVRMNWCYLIRLEECAL